MTDLAKVFVFSAIFALALTMMAPFHFTIVINAPGDLTLDMSGGKLK